MVGVDEHRCSTYMPGRIDTDEFLRESNAIENVHSDDALEDACEAWDYLKQQDELTHEVVLETHNHLLRNRQPDIAGEYRTVHVRIGGDIPPHPSVVHDLMDALLDTTPTTASEAIEWHVTFEKIHPFADGNGRVGRLLYLWHCREHLGVEPVLWRAKDVAGYYALFQTASNPETRL